MTNRIPLTEVQMVIIICIIIDVIAVIAAIIMKLHLYIPVAQQPMYENVINQDDDEHPLPIPNLDIATIVDIIQEEYQPLARISSNAELFELLVDERLQQLIYPIHLNYINLIQNSEQINIIEMNTVCKMFQIYSLEYNEHSINKDYLIERFHCLLKEVLLTDLVTVIKRFDDDFRKNNIHLNHVFEIYNNMRNRDVFIRQLNNMRTMIRN